MTALQPPAADPPITADGQHSQAWTAHFQEVADAVSGIGVGVTDGSDAAAGRVGEFLSASGGPIGLSAGVAADVASLILSAGDWEAWGSVLFAPSGAVSALQAWIAALPAAAPGPGALAAGGLQWLRATFTAGMQQTLVAGRVRFNVAATTTIYLSAAAGFAGSATASGFLAARRMR